MNINIGNFNPVPLTHGLAHAAVQGQGRKNGIPQELKEVQGTRDPLQSSNRLYSEKILQELNKALGKAGEKYIEQLNPNDFSPQAVADRILKFVEMGVNNIRNTQGDAAAREAFAEAKMGISMGFQEATSILSSLGVFSGAIEKNANQTYSLLQEGLAQLDKKMFSSEGSQGQLDVVV